MTRWHNVQHSLPDHDCRCVCRVVHDLEADTGDDFYDYRVLNFYTSRMYWGIGHIYRVTHWMEVDAGGAS